MIISTSMLTISSPALISLANNALVAEPTNTPVFTAMLYLLLVIMGLFFSSIFSGIETACYTASRLKLLIASTQGQRRAILIRDELNELPRLISSLLIGNNIANYLASFGITAILANVLHLNAWTVIVLQAALLAPALFLFGEAFPKEFCRAHADNIMHRTVHFVRITRWGVTWVGLLPIVNGASTILSRLAGTPNSPQRVSARARMSAVLTEGVNEGLLTERQIKLVERLFENRLIRVHELMTPWSNVDTFSATMTRGALARWHSGVEHSRFPVLDDSNGSVLGTMPIMRALTASADQPFSDLVRTAVVMSQDTELCEALETMRINGAAIAIIGTANAPVGVVTCKDLLDPLLGSLKI